jgi:hypothetical protein
MNNPTDYIWRTVQRHQGLLIIIALALVVLPFVGLSFYNHPSLDDIMDAMIVRQLGFWEAQKHFYTTHTGRYTTTVLLALVNPLIYGRLETHWWVVTLGFVGGTLLVLRLCIAELPRLSNGARWRLAGLLLAVWLAYAPGQAEGLYWFTGAYTYVASAWLLLLWLVALSRYTTARHTGTGSRMWLVSLAGLTVAVAGTTEPIALPFLLTLLAGAVLSLCQKQYRVLLGLAALALAGSVVSFTASGNFVRMSTMGASFGLLKTLIYSAATTAYLLLTWAGNPVLLVLSTLLMPVIYRLALQRDHLLVTFLARLPAVLLAGGLVVLLAAANSPAFYASGTGLPLRARTTLYLLFLVGWFGVLLTWCCRQVSLGMPSRVLAGLVTGRLAPLRVGLLLVFFMADYNLQTRASMVGQGSNNVVRAYREWLGGEAARYDAELRARYQTIQSGAPVVTIYPLQNKPDLLFCFDVTRAEDPIMLRYYAQYFGVPRIIDAPAPPVEAEK